MLTAPDIIKQLDQARELAFSNHEMFPQVLRQILNFVNNPEISIKQWCSTFLKDAFESDESIMNMADRTDLAMDTLDSLIVLCNVDDLTIFKNTIDVSIVVYKLVFRYVSDNDGCNDIWGKLSELKTNLTSKFNSTYPLSPSDNEEHDNYRNLISKIELIKFMVLIIDYQTKSNSNVKHFSLNFVNPSHTLIKRQFVQEEAFGLLDKLLGVFNKDILIIPLINPILSQLTLLMKRKSHMIPKILNVIENFDTNSKYQSNYQTIEQFKLSKKFIDRVVKIFLNHCFKYQLVPNNHQQALNRKVAQLTQRGDEIRKKNIVEPSDDDVNIKKRKFDGFVNSSKRLKTLDYKNLYCLTDVNDDLNNFDLATLPQNILISMTLSALNRADPSRLNKALDIISERYKYGISNSGTIEQDTVNGGEAKKSEKDGDDVDEDIEYNPSNLYNLPPPKELSFQDRKDQVNLIIKNFFKLSEQNVDDVEELQNKEDNGINKELTKVAISSWKKNAWLVILTRLATRGMRPVDSIDPSVDNDKSGELSDMIRLAIFDFFLENIHSRIDLIIEWLNEEWYSERVFNEAQVKNQIKQELLEKYEDDKDEMTDLNELINQQLETKTIKTPIYNIWAGKVLDSLIPFLEANDRKIFIRLLSDLPYLDEELVLRIKSLCFDPVRIKLGFLSLQFLIMYRPPIKSTCINILKDLANSDQQDLKDEASQLLAKYGE